MKNQYRVESSEYRGKALSRRLAVLLLVTGSSLLATSHAALFSASGKGTASGQFLKFGAGARSAGLGEAFTVLPGDATALYWNAAGLSSVENWSLSLMHMVGVEDTSFEYGAFAKKLGGGVLGLGVQAYSAGELVKTDVNGLETGTFSPMDFALSLGYGRKIQGFSVGASGKFVSSKIVDTATGFGLDLGLLTPSTMDGKLKFGFAVQNLAGSLSFGDESESLPLAAKLGGLFTPLKELNVALDIVLPSDNQAGGALGVEYNCKVSDSFTVSPRLGGNTRTLGDLDGFTGLSFGLGFGLKDIGIDYAFVPAGDLGVSHKISLSVN